MSNVTLRNGTAVPVEFVVAIEDHVLGRPYVERGCQAAVPTNLYQVTAATLLEGNRYMTAPVDVSPGTGFLARILQRFQQGTYEFTLSVFGAPPGVFIFEKATIGPVTFTIVKLGIVSDSVVVTNAFLHKTVVLDVDTYSVVALVKGVVTASVVTTDLNATVTLAEGSVDGEYVLVTK
jgi:hypothetical protein